MRSRLRFLRFGALCALCALLAACGFQLRGAWSLPYESIYIAVPEHSVIGVSIKRAIRASEGTRVTDSAKDAQATFLPTGEARESEILSLSGSGRVREKRLKYRYGYRVVDGKGRDLVLPGTVELTRDLSYADSDVLAKTQEEDLLWRDMENDLVQQLLRRLSTARPTPAATE